MVWLVCSVLLKTQTGKPFFFFFFFFFFLLIFYQNEGAYVQEQKKVSKHTDTQEYWEGQNLAKLMET